MKTPEVKTVFNLDEANKTKKSDFYKVDPRRIVFDTAFNIREDYGDIESLKNQIIEHGVKVALQGYREKIENSDEYTYFLTDGFRRMTAVLLAIEEGHEIAAVPFIVHDKRNYPEEQRILDMFLLNGGKNLTVLETSALFVKLVGYGWEASDIAKKTGTTEASVSNLLLLDSAPMAVKKQIVAGKISATMVMEIVRENQGDSAKQIEIVNAAITEALESGKTKATKQHVEKVGGSKKASDKKERLVKLDRVISKLAETYQIEEKDLDKLTKAIQAVIKPKKDKK